MLAALQGVLGIIGQYENGNNGSCLCLVIARYFDGMNIRVENE